MAAASRVFLRRGLHGATIREIVGEAGLTAPALYYHFEGKEDVYAQLIHSGTTRFRELVESVLAAGNGDPARGLEAIAAACIRFGAEDPVRLRIVYADLFGTDAPDDPDLGLRRLREWTRDRVEDVLRTAARSGSLPLANPALAARLFVATLAGLLAEQARRPDEVVLDESLAAEVVHVFLRGVAHAAEDR